jgi:hypothetical protein
MNYQRRAFGGHVEILPVIAIIALLISILLPSLARARLLSRLERVDRLVKSYERSRQALMPFAESLKQKEGLAGALAVLNEGNEQQKVVEDAKKMVSERKTLDGSKEGVRDTLNSTEERMQQYVASLDLLKESQFPGWIAEVREAARSSLWDGRIQGLFATLGGLVVLVIVVSILSARKDAHRRGYRRAPECL